MPEQRAAVIDCGTNSTRLLVSEANVGGPVTLSRQTRVTRLGQGVDQHRKFSGEALERNAEVLADYRAMVDELAVERFRVLATSATRDVDNASALEAQVEKLFDVPLEVISGEDEGRLAFRGATRGRELGPTLVLDIGGGSTELIEGVPGRDPNRVHSLDIGSVRLTERFIASDPPDPLELSQVVLSVRSLVEDAADTNPRLRQVETLIGVAGTITTVAAIELGLHEYDPDRIHGLRLNRASVEEVFRTMATESLEDRKHNPGLPADRADVIVAGAAILAAVMRTLGLPQCEVSERDLLDGAMEELLAGS